MDGYTSNQGGKPMKTKLTLRYIGMVILSTLLLLVGAFFVLTWIENNIQYDSISGNIAYNFSQEVEWTDEGELLISEEGQKVLLRQKGWVQFIDEEGYVVEAFNTPSYLTDHYSPTEIVQFNLYPNNNPNQVLSMGKINDEIDFLVVIPSETWHRWHFEFDNSWLVTFVQTMLILAGLLFVVMGYIFSRRITKPVTKIIHGVEGLSEGNYSINYKEQGLYKPVFRQLNQLATRLESSEIEREKTRKLRGKWISNMSHDLKTPLSSIKGYSEILADAEYNLTPDGISKYSETIHEKSLYMEEMIEELRLNERLMHDAIVLNKEKKNLTSFIREIVIDSLNHPKYSDRSIVFQTTDEEIEYAFDKELMWRCIENLIYNALIHSGEETKVIVSIEQLSDHILIEIEDNGRGMTDEELDQLFNRYYRGSNTANYKGTGLGMSIAKEVIEAHDGEIQVESEVDKGTKIRILL